MPVELPMPHEILGPPSPPESIHNGFDDDLESGRRAMREREQENGLISASRRITKPQPPVPRDNAAASGSSFAPVKAPSPAPSVTPPTETIVDLSSPPPEIPDLLSEQAPAMATNLITPMSPALSTIDIPEPKPETPANVVEDAVEPVLEENVDPDTTIRLVGGGGTVGVSETPVLPPAEVKAEAGADSDAASVNSVTSDASVAKKTHKKAKSGLAGLKKLGQLGRKKDSSSSVKDLVGA